ncbi:hypothetical protein EJB05_07274, partial [Eragrostis curvula]
MAARWIHNCCAWEIPDDTRDSMLLEQKARFTDSVNRTTAVAQSMGGYTMAVSFWIANPPDLSFFSVRCSKPPNSFKSPNFKVLPHVVGAEGPFVLFRVRFYGSIKDEYFMYTAARDSKPPSLEWVAPPSDDNRDSLSRVKEFGVVYCGYGCHYLVVALCDAPSDYKLRIYSSKTKSWSTRTLLNPCPEVKKIVPEKVIEIGEGSLGWVDFSYGLLVCDWRQDFPCLQFIPLPEPLPENRDRLKKACDPGVSARWFRDLICANGVLKFIEMEHRFKGTEKLIDPSDMDVLCDSDLIMSLRHRDMDEKHKSRDGWRAFTWTREVWSGCWSNRHTFDAADISVNESFYPSLLSGLRGKSVGKFTFKDMYSAFPTLSPNGSILYLKAMVEPNDKNGLIVTIDLGIKTLKALGVYSFENLDPSIYAFRFCNLAGHLDMSPGIEVSACIKTTERGSSANDPDSKSVSILSLRMSPSPANQGASPDPEGKFRSFFPVIEDLKVDFLLFIRLLVDGKMKRARNPWAHPLHNLQCFGMLDNRGRPEVMKLVSAIGDHQNLILRAPTTRLFVPSI